MFSMVEPRRNRLNRSQGANAVLSGEVARQWEAVTYDG